MNSTKKSHSKKFIFEDFNFWKGSYIVLVIVIIFLLIDRHNVQPATTVIMEDTYQTTNNDNNNNNNNNNNNKLPSNIQNTINTIKTDNNNNNNNIKNKNTNLVNFESMTLSEFQRTAIPIEDFIVQGTTTDGKSGWVPWPIGYCFQIMFDEFQNNTEKPNWFEKIQINGNHNELLLMAMSTNTDNHRPNSIRSVGRHTNRNEIAKNLISNGFKNIKLDPKQYFETLSNYQFVASPEGNGIDCHRHYESLMAGCIVIIEKIHKHFIESKYGYNMPILWTTDYSEITPNYLNQIYPIMLEKKYNFTQLFFRRWSIDHQKEIIKCADHWSAKHKVSQWKWYHNT